MPPARAPRGYASGAICPVADRLYGNARIAYHASRQLNPLALEWFREAEGAALSDAQRAWRIRAALRSGAWADVLATIDVMPPVEAQEPVWRYWKARALTAAGRGAEATPIYEALADDLGFYGLLSAEALGRRLAVTSAPLVPEPEALAAFGARPAVQRVVKLAQLDMRAESQREWLYVVRGLPDEVCCSQPSMHGARVCTIVQSTPPTAPRCATISACGT
jgi:soluble lytic murein transglycosylase